MKWKKVSEHPLPEGDGIKVYILKWVTIEGDKTIIDFVHYPIAYSQGRNIIEWCEFNPDEIESAEVQTYDVSEQFKNLDAPYLLNELHDEIESVDSLDVPSVLKGKSEYKSATEVMGEFRAKQEAAMNQALFAKRMIEEPSWEEKFRWETARDILCAELSNPNGVTQTEEHLKNVVRSVDNLIAELKRGRE